MNLNERKRLIRWVFKMYRAYALLCDKGDRDNVIFKDEARDARDEISKAIFLGQFDDGVARGIQGVAVRATVGHG